MVDMPLVNEHTNCTENTLYVASVTGAATGASGATTGSDCVTSPMCLLARIFCDASLHSIPNRLRELEARFRSCPTGVVDVHSLVGLCASFGLHETLTNLEMFRAAPSEAGIAALWSLLDTKRQRLKVGEPVSQISASVKIHDTREHVEDTYIGPSTREFFYSVPRGSGLGAVAGASRLVRNGQSSESSVCLSPTRVDRSGQIMVSPFSNSGETFQRPQPTEPIVCVGIDDDAFIRDRHVYVFAKLGATASISLGATREEQVAFVTFS